MIHKDYISVIVPLHRERIDAGGISYREKEIVVFLDFKNDESISTGLAGYKTTEKNIYTFSPVCALVKVESYSKIPGNLIKFESGYVIYIGSKEDCLEKAKNE